MERETHRQRGDGWEGSCATSAGMSVSVLVCKNHRERVSVNTSEDLSITWACWEIVSVHIIQSLYVSTSVVP